MPGIRNQLLKPTVCKESVANIGQLCFLLAVPACFCLPRQIGFFLGSAVIPIKTPRRPRVTLLVMACLMFLFAPCFAAALMMHARPYAFLALALAMHTYSG